MEFDLTRLLDTGASGVLVAYVIYVNHRKLDNLKRMLQNIHHDIRKSKK